MKTRILRSSGNVFADLGLEDADELLVRSELTHRIATIIEKRGLSQAQAAVVLGVDRAKVSKLLRGSALQEFSCERLMRFLTRLGQDVELVVRKGKRRLGHIQVKAA